MKEAYLEFEDVPLLFDVVEQEGHVHRANVTEHAVEEGSDVADHVRNENATITLEVFVSNTPVRDVNDIYGGRVAGLELQVPRAEKSIAPTPGAAMGAALDAIGDLINPPAPWKAMTLQFPEKFNNVSFIFGTLLDWKERGVLGKVITPHRTYENMVITGVEMKLDADTGDGAPISLELREIRIVEAEMVTAPVPTEERGKVKKNMGRQPTSIVRGEEQKKSLFQKIKEGLRG